VENEEAFGKKDLCWKRQHLQNERLVDLWIFIVESVWIFPLVFGTAAKSQEIFNGIKYTSPSAEANPLM